MSRIDPAAIEVASICDVGRQRATNQDRCADGHTADGGRWLMVADGMGGHAGGETASRLAVECAERGLGAEHASSGSALGKVFETANRSIHEAAQRDGSLHGMGTTGVAILFGADGSAHVANVGDSRAYRMRGDVLEPLTRDHSLVGELRRRGDITEAEARVHPRRNEVLRSLGVLPEVEVDVDPIEVQPGDRYLLCSDGLCGVLDDDEIAAVVRREPAEEAVRTLVDRVNQRGGPDNVTVQIAVVPGSRGRSVRIASICVAVVALGLSLAWLAGVFDGAG